MIETKEKHLQSSNPLKWLICILFTSQDSLCFLRMLMEAKLTSTSFASSPRKTWMVHLYNVDNRDDAFAGWWWWAFQPSTSSLNCLLVKRTPAQNPSKLYLENLKIFVIWKPENICYLKTWKYLFFENLAIFVLLIVDPLSESCRGVNIKFDLSKEFPRKTHFWPFEKVFGVEITPCQEIDTGVLQQQVLVILSLQCIGYCPISNSGLTVRIIVMINFIIIIIVTDKALTGEVKIVISATDSLKQSLCLSK